MTLIVDASVAAKWFVDEELREQAMRLLDVDDLDAPDLIVAEMANFAWRKCIRGEIGERQAGEIAEVIPTVLSTLHPAAELVEDALAIAIVLNHPVYDCLYIACAERTGGLLITADTRLHRVLRGSPYAELVRHLRDFGLA